MSQEQTELKRGKQSKAGWVGQQETVIIEGEEYPLVPPGMVSDAKGVETDPYFPAQGQGSGYQKKDGRRSATKTR